MRKERSLVWVVMVLLVVSSMLLASCGAPPTACSHRSRPLPQPRPLQPPSRLPQQRPRQKLRPRPPSTGTTALISLIPTEPVTVSFASFNDLETPFWQGIEDRI